MKDNDEYIRRFSTYRILEHWIHALAFIVLVSTGLSQKFYEYGISQWIIMSIGGIDNLRIIHRCAGIFYTLILLEHILVNVIGVLFLKWKTSMVINKNDFMDLIQNLKYYLGISEHPAKCDRYDYKQKFEYWGVLVSALIMVTTGFTLWFPTLAARFLPGEFIPAAKVLHTNQALLIFLIITIWHIYTAIFSPDVFPINKTMFHGMISKTQMIEKHPLEYERMFNTWNINRAENIIQKQVIIRR